MNFLSQTTFMFPPLKQNKRCKSRYLSFVYLVEFNLSIFKFGLSVCLSVCLYPINVKTAEPIGPNFFVGSRVTPGKVYG